MSDGTIIGDVESESLRLRRSAILIGGVTCQSLSMDPEVSISGKLNVHRKAPDRLHLEGDDAPEDEVVDSSDANLRSGTEYKPRDDERHRSKSSGGSSKKDGSSKKEGGGGDKERRERDDKGKDTDEKSKDEGHRKKPKEGGSSESSKSKTTTK